MKLKGVVGVIVRAEGTRLRQLDQEHIKQCGGIAVDLDKTLIGLISIILVF